MYMENLDTHTLWEKMDREEEREEYRRFQESVCDHINFIIVRDVLDKNKYEQAQFLFECVAENNIPLLVYALEEGLDPNHPRPKGDPTHTLFEFAFFYKDDSRISKILIEFGAQIPKRFLDYVKWSRSRTLFLLQHGVEYNYNDREPCQRAWCRRVKILLFLLHPKQKFALSSDLVRLLDTFGI